MELSEIWIGIIIPIVIGPIFIYIKTLRDEISERKYTKAREKYKAELETVYNLLNNFYWPLYITLLSIQQYNYQIPLKNRYRYDSDDTNSTQNSEENDINFNVSQSKIDDNSQKKVNSNDHYYRNDDAQSKSPIDMVSDSSNENFEVAINISPTGQPDKTRLSMNKRPSRMRTRNCVNFRNIILDKGTLSLLKENLEEQYICAEKIIENNITKSCIYAELNFEMIKFIKYTKIRKIINEGSPEQEYNIEYFGINNNLESLIDTTRIYLEKTNEKYKNLINNPV